MEDLSEREQIERLREWWRENGWYIVGGIALGALLLFGWNQYQAWQEQRAVGASTVYQSLAAAVEADDERAAGELFATLRDEHGSSPYADQAGLLMARLHLRRSEPERAAEVLRDVMRGSSDEELALVARLRLARVLAYLEAYQEALQVLDVRDAGPYTGRLHEVRGDVHAAMGDAAAARAAYMQALVAPGSEFLDRSFLQMKLNDLPAPEPDAAQEDA